jgi:hypothetical protein
MALLPSPAIFSAILVKERANLFESFPGRPDSDTFAVFGRVLELGTQRGVNLAISLGADAPVPGGLPQAKSLGAGPSIERARDVTARHHFRRARGM